jgi:hypothetical protein
LNVIGIATVRDNRSSVTSNDLSISTSFWRIAFAFSDVPHNASGNAVKKPVFPDPGEDTNAVMGFFVRSAIQGFGTSRTLKDLTTALYASMSSTYPASENRADVS